MPEGERGVGPTKKGGGERGEGGMCGLLVGACNVRDV